jgi:hypothetical protein
VIKKVSVTTKFIMSVKGCARCSGNHKNLEVFALANPPDDYTYYATCPKLGQPILVKKITHEIDDDR